MYGARLARAAVVTALLLVDGPGVVAQHMEARYGRQVDVPLDELIRLTNAPSRGCLSTAFSPPEGDAAPVVVCTYPADGERIPPKTRFAIRFSRAMDEDSFRGRVFLRYAQRRGPARHRIGELVVEYDPELRALFLAPRRPLLPGLELELRLIEGVADSEGRDLVTRPDVRSPSGSVERLSFQIENQEPD